MIIAFENVKSIVKGIFWSDKICPAEILIYCFITNERTNSIRKSKRLKRLGDSIQN